MDRTNSITSLESLESPAPGTQRAKLASKLYQQFKDGKFCDAEIKLCDGRSIRAHRSVLAAYSKFFEKALDPDSPFSEAKTGVIQLPDYPPLIIIIVNQLYTQHPVILEVCKVFNESHATICKVLIELYNIAEKYLVDILDDIHFAFGIEVRLLKDLEGILDVANVVYRSSSNANGIDGFKGSLVQVGAKLIKKSYSAADLALENPVLEHLLENPKFLRDMLLTMKDV